MSELDNNTRQQMRDISQEERIAKLEAEVKRLDTAITSATRGAINAQNLAKTALEASQEASEATKEEESTKDTKRSLLDRLMGR